MTQNQSNSREKRFPKVGVGVSLYGSVPLGFEQDMRQWLHAGIPLVEIHGCAYQEMARGEICRRALIRKPDGLECLVMVDGDQHIDADTIRALSELALKTGKIVASHYDEFSVRFPNQYGGATCSPLAITAIPTGALEFIVEQTKKVEPAFFNRPADSSLNPENEFYPIFSPFTFAKIGESRKMLPLVDAAGSCAERLSPDHAFLIRAQKLGVQICSLYRADAGPYGRIRTVWRNESNAGPGRYLIAVACFGALDVEQRKALWELEKAGEPIFEVHGHPHIDVARDAMAQAALDRGCSGVFMLDHDIIFTPEDILKLCRQAEERQAVVGVPYCMRKTGHSIIGAFALSSKSEVGFFEDGGLYPAAYTGMGFTAIPRAILEQATERAAMPTLVSGLSVAPPLFSLRVEDGYYAGEDVSFCTRVHDIDGRQLDGTNEWVMRPRIEGKIFLDTRPRIFHKGAYKYGIEDASFAVPRYTHLKSVLTANQEETRAVMRYVDELNVADQERSIGVAEGLSEDAQHPILKPTKNISPPAASP